MLLPGAAAATTRQQAARLLARYIGADPSLVGELQVLAAAQRELQAVPVAERSIAQVLAAACAEAASCTKLATSSGSLTPARHRPPPSGRPSLAMAERVCDTRLRRCKREVGPSSSDGLSDPTHECLCSQIGIALRLLVPHPLFGQLRMIVHDRHPGVEMRYKAFRS